MTESPDRYPSHWINETTIPQKKRLIIDKDLIRSGAFVKLKAAAKQIILELYMRLTVDSYRRSRNKKEQTFYASNNGKLKLSYDNIERMTGHSSATISKAIDQLCDYGFMEIAEIGVGVERKSHKIALIKNWRDYGTPDFRPGKGKKGNKPINGGFKKKSTSETKEQ